MKKALVSTIQDNYVVQVEEQTFPVHENLVWVDCPNTVKAYEYKYNFDTEEFEEIEIEEEENA